MEEAYMDDAIESIESDILIHWLYSHDESDTDEYKIFDLSKKFKVPTKTVVEVVKGSLKTDYQKSLSTKELKGIYSTLKLHEDSEANKLQMEIIQSILNERN
jgi:hypothetical protein